MTHPLLRSKVVHMRVGKTGITDSMIEELNEQFKAKDALQIKFLKSFREDNDRKEAAKEIAKKTRSHVAELRGGTLILSRKR